MRKDLFGFLLLFLPMTLAGQATTDTAGLEKQPGFLLSGITYTNNNSNTRLVNAIKMPALIAGVSYYSSFGLWASGNFDRYLSATTNTFDAEVKVGYEKTFRDRFEVGFSYAYRKFTGDAAFEGVAYKHALDLSGTYRLKDLSFTAENSFLVGPTKNYFLDFSLSYDFKLDGFPIKSGSLAFSPTLLASFGTTYWITNTMDHVWGNHMGNGHMWNYVPPRKFDYQFMSLLLPVQYSLGHFILSGGWFYSIPSNTLKEQSWTNQSGFLVSLNYIVIFKK